MNIASDLETGIHHYNTVRNGDSEMDEDFQMFEITVRVWIKKDADPVEVINEADYVFKHEDIIDTEIVDIVTEN